MQTTTTKLAAVIDFPTLYNELKKNGIEPKLPAGGAQGAGPSIENITIANIVNTVLPYIYVIAGLILFAYIVMGGYELLLSGGDPEKTKSGGKKITSAIVGFVILFAAFWITQLIELLLGIKIL